MLTSLEGDPTKGGDERGFPLARDGQFQARAWAFWRLGYGFETLGFLGYAGMVLARQGFQQRGFHRPSEVAEGGKVLCQSVIIDQAPVFTLIAAHNVIVAIIEQFGTV